MGITLQLKDISRDCNEKRKYLLIVWLGPSEAQSTNFQYQRQVDSSSFTKPHKAPVEQTDRGLLHVSMFVHLFCFSPGTTFKC